LQSQKVSEEITIDKKTNKVVINTVETVELTDEKSKEDIKKKLKKELADIVRKVQGFKMRAEQIKALLARLDQAPRKTKIAP